MLKGEIIADTGRKSHECGRPKSNRCLIQKQQQNYWLTISTVWVISTAYGSLELLLCSEWWEMIFQYSLISCPFDNNVGFSLLLAFLCSLNINTTTWVTWEYLCLLKTNSTNIEKRYYLDYNSYTNHSWIFIVSSLHDWYYTWLLY